MTLRLTCACGTDFGSFAPEQIAAAMIQAHATCPHSAPGHGFTVTPAPVGPVEVRIECQGLNGKGCDRPEKAARYMVPEWFASGAVMQHHSAHEGHVLRVWLNGAEVVPC